jgi:hypothetical protein
VACVQSLNLNWQCAYNMIVKAAGHKYGVQTANGVEVLDIIFCKNEGGQFYDGITNEEILEILMHRVDHFATLKPSQENMNVLTHLMQAKKWMSVRNFKKIQNRKSNDDRRNGVHLQAKSGQAGQQIPG